MEWQSDLQRAMARRRAGIESAGAVPSPPSSPTRRPPGIVPPPRPGATAGGRGKGGEWPPKQGTEKTGQGGGLVVPSCCSQPSREACSGEPEVRTVLISPFCLSAGGIPQVQLRPVDGGPARANQSAAGGPPKALNSHVGGGMHPESSKSRADEGGRRPGATAAEAAGAAAGQAHTMRPPPKPAKPESLFRRIFS